MRQLNRQCDLTHPMRLFRHGPFRLNAQSFARDLMAVAVPTHEISDATGQRTDEEFDRTHPGILPSILNRLIAHYSMLAARDVISSSTMICRGEFHVALHAQILCFS
jgi:hypothetical protein